LVAVAVALAVAVVRRNGIARERMVAADLSRALEATASILAGLREASRSTGAVTGNVKCTVFCVARATGTSNGSTELGVGATNGIESNL
jgi:hypothetical protein